MTNKDYADKSWLHPEDERLPTPVRILNFALFALAAIVGGLLALIALSLA